MEELETFYMMLDSAAGLLPRSAPEEIREAMNHLVSNVAFEIAKKADPKTMSDVRNYDGFDRFDEHIAFWMTSFVLDEAGLGDEQASALYQELRNIPIDEVLDAPVDTAQELASWLLQRAALRSEPRRGSRPS